MRFGYPKVLKLCTDVCTYISKSVDPQGLSGSVRPYSGPPLVHWVTQKIRFMDKCNNSLSLKYIQQPLLLQLQLTLHKIPKLLPTLWIGRIRHRFRSPYPIKIPPTALPSPLRNGTLFRSRRPHNRKTALLGIDAEDPDKHVRQPVGEGHRLGVLCGLQRRPDPRAHVAWVDALDGDVAQGGSAGEARLQLREKGLEVQLVVRVGARVGCAVRVGEVKRPEELHAGCRAYDAGIFGAG
jgi:hypothetical protein